jgi:hypothetical protein
MKLSTIQEAINAEVDEPVLAIRGKLSKLFTRMNGESQYGPWTLQNGQLEADGQTIKVVFSNRDEIPGDWRNEIIELRCVKGSKGGWSGVKRTIDKKDKTPTLTVSDKGEVIHYRSEHQPEPQTAPANGQPKASGSPQGAPQPSGSGVVPRADEYASEAGTVAMKSVAEKMADGMNQMYQIANTQYAALMTVHEYLVPLLKEKGITIDPQQEAALVQNMLIQMYYQKGHHYFPGKRLGQHRQQAQQTANDETQPAA